MTAYSRPNDAELGQLSRLQNELYELVSKGQLPVAFVKRSLQTLLDGTFLDITVNDVVEHIHDLFVPTWRQIENIEEWNQCFSWGFTHEQIRQATDSAPKWPENKLVAVVLVPYLDDVWTTFDDLWSTAAVQQAICYRYDAFDAEFLRLREEIQHPGKCLRWEVIDLAAMWDSRNGKAPKDVRDHKSAHAAILAAAAHHPRWVRAMDGKNVPYVWLAGYECGMKRDQIPWLQFVSTDQLPLKLLAHSNDHAFCGSAVPILLDP